uniref:Uncharacterized protein n=1 Tax=Anguilla anguilla TaxID=7936 RepID=A0A0E9XRA8_ANGAN
MDSLRSPPLVNKTMVNISAILPKVLLMSCNVSFSSFVILPICRTRRNT